MTNGHRRIETLVVRRPGMVAGRSRRAGFDAAVLEFAQLFRRLHRVPDVA